MKARLVVHCRPGHGVHPCAAGAAEVHAPCLVAFTPPPRRRQVRKGSSPDRADIGAPLTSPANRATLPYPPCIRPVVRM